MTDITAISTKFTIQYEKGSFSNAKVHDLASNESILTLVKAINSIQAKPAKSFKKIVTSELSVS